MSETNDTTPDEVEGVGSPISADDSSRTVIEFTDEELKQPMQAETAPSTALVPVQPTEILPAFPPRGPVGPPLAASPPGGRPGNARQVASKIGITALVLALIGTATFFLGQSTRKPDTAVDAQIAAIQRAQNAATNKALAQQKKTYAKLTRQRASAAFAKGERNGYNKGYKETSTPAAGATQNAYDAGKSEGYQQGYTCGAAPTCSYSPPGG